MIADTVTPTTTGWTRVPRPGRWRRSIARRTRTMPQVVLTIQKATPLVATMPLTSIV